MSIAHVAGQASEVVSPQSHVFLGVFREPWEEFCSGVSAASIIQCSCGVSLQTFEALRKHWAMGHFDEPVYARIEDVLAKKGKI